MVDVVTSLHFTNAVTCNTCVCESVEIFGHEYICETNHTSHPTSYTNYSNVWLLAHVVIMNTECGGTNPDLSVHKVLIWLRWVG